jgi:radical SAM protein with 4Fe4S-binding SPASM domain
MIEMYFRLNPECYLIRGERCGAIFDLIDTKIYALNQQETKLVTACEKNDPISGDEKLLNELKQLCLGNFYPNKIYVQKLRVGSRENKYNPLNPIEPPDLHRAFLEINNSCNRDCWFCGYHGIKRSLGCMGCNKWKENGSALSIEKWKIVIDGLRDLRCRDIFITGGDLTLAWDNTLEILDYASRKFSNIYTILHQQSISSEKLDNLDNMSKVIVQTDDLNGAQYENLLMLLVVEPGRGGDTNSLKRKNIMKDYIIGNRKFLSNNRVLTSKNKIMPVNMYKFLDNIEYHPCLGHTLAICHNGNVTPCPLMRRHKFGNVRNSEIYTVFEKEWRSIYEFWGLNLDKIDRCTGCEFRYACTDCRALEENLTGKLDGKRLCSYNPKEGEWY